MHAQNNQLAIKIDSIVVDKNLVDQKQFYIHYQLQNLTNNTISFFINTEIHLLTFIKKMVAKAMIQLGLLKILIS